MKTHHWNGFDYNPNFADRDARLTPMFPDTYGNIMWYTGMNINTLQWMIDNQFADPLHQHGGPYTIAQFAEFMAEHPEFLAIGHVTRLPRQDYRLTIEGVLCEHEISVHTAAHFVAFAKTADELDTKQNYYRAWWD